MLQKLPPVLYALYVFTGVSYAQTPNVVTDIAPVHSLVATVMQGVGEPSLIVRQGASPHEYSLTPQEAANLQSADMVVWLGAGLTPWLEARISGLASDAVSIELLENPQTLLLDRRDTVLFESHDHDGHADEEEHKDHDDHADHDDHDEHDHGHDGQDPHAWLDPQNASIWMAVIAADLSRLDPENADKYAQNATDGIADLTALTAQLQADLAPLRDRPFIVFHDAYQYYETRFGVHAAGALNLSDATRASASRVAELRAVVTDGGITCAMSEPQFNDRIIDSVFGDLVTKGVLDPLGTSHGLGPDLYGQTLQSIADSFMKCLATTK